MPDALAYFLTWPTYGTWMPGDERGWIKYRKGMQGPDSILKREAAARMTEDACRLDREQRQLVEATINDHCQTRGWTLLAVNCRSNHLHVVVASMQRPKKIRGEFKAWCTRRLKELEIRRRGGESVSCGEGSCDPAKSTPEVRENWWAERGSGIYINDDECLQAVIHYVLEGQDQKETPTSHGR